MRLYIKPILLAIFATFLFLSFSPINFVNAQTTANQYGEPLSDSELSAIEAQLTSQNNSCPEPVKQYFLNKVDAARRGEEIIYGRGTFIIAYNDTDQSQPVVLTCANASVIQKIIIRAFVFLFTILGFVVTFSIGKSTVLMMTAFDNDEQFGNGVKGLINAFLYTAGVLFAYGIFIFVAIGVLGIGTNSQRPEYNLFCQNRIILNLTFDQAEQC
jgi:hypothetical protein